VLVKFFMEAPALSRAIVIAVREEADPVVEFFNLSQPRPVSGQQAFVLGLEPLQFL